MGGLPVPRGDFIYGFSRVVTTENDVNGRKSFLRRLDSTLERFLRGLLPEERRYLILVPIVGVLSGLVAVGLEKALLCVKYVAWGTSHSTRGEAASMTEAARQMAESRPWMIPLVLAAGGALVAIAGLFLKLRDRFQGTAGLVEALAFKKGRLRLGRTFGEGLVSIAAVGTGASLGREGAMVHGGAALGSWLGAKFRLDDYHVKLLLACGAAGGLAAAYKAPIGASIFAMEILLGTLAMEIFGPIIICSVLSTTIAYVVFGSQPVYEVFHYQISSPWEVFLDLGLGVILGFVSVLCIKVFSRVSDLFAWLGPAARWKSIVAMGILGLVAIRFPELLGNGYDTVNDVVNGRLRPSLGLLILLPVSKILVTALCRAGGVPGGLFTPSLFIGALLGCAYGVVANQIFPPGHVSNPGAYALVGMGAIVAGTLQAPITAIIMIFELTRDYQSILPLMSACVASALVSHFLGVGSLYTEPLRRRGIHLPTAIAPPWIRQPTVRSVINTVVATVGPADRFQQVVDRFLKTPEGQDHLYVTREDGTCSGVISLHDIKRFIRSSEHLDGVIADDILTESFPYVYADDPLSRAIEIFSQHSFERLPVLDDPESRRLLGTVSKRKILAAYSESNLARQRVRTVVPVLAEKEGKGDP